MHSFLIQRITSVMQWSLIGLIGISASLNLSESLAQEPMSPGRYKAPMKYAVQLPKYCWGQFFGRTEPQYNMPPQNICSPGMNHFCGALVDLMRARESMDKRQKAGYFRSAEKEILYTKRAMERYPQCPLRRDMERALAEAQAGLAVFGR